MINTINRYSPHHIKLTLVLISLAIATQVQYIQHGWINSDSVLYLEAAKLFAAGEWDAGYTVYSWPFYSLWIAATHTITHLSIHQSAQLLNVLFFGITCASFLTIIQLAGGKQLQLVAGGMVLLSAHYLIGGVLEMLMRDEGFWAFYLTSLVFFIKYYQQQQIQHALLWQIAICCAVLFRIEAALYLILLPLLVLPFGKVQTSQKLKRLLQAYSLQIVIATSFIAIIQINDAFSASMLGRFNEIFTPNLFNDFTRKFQLKSELMGNTILGNYLDEFATVGLMLTFIFVMIAKTVKSTGIINLALAFFCIKNSEKILEVKAEKVLLTAATISIVNMAIIITKVFVLSGRYTVGLALPLMILGSFYFAHLIEENNKKSSKYRRWIIGLLIIAMTLGFVKNLIPKKEGYNFRQDAAAWLVKANKKNHAVFYDEKRLRYFANEPFIGNYPQNSYSLENKINKEDFNQYQYLMMTVNKKYPSYEKIIAKRLPNFTEIKRFYSNKKNKSIVIYERK